MTSRYLTKMRGLTAVAIAALAIPLSMSAQAQDEAPPPPATELVARMHRRMVAAIAALLASAPDARFDDPPVTGMIVLSALVGPVRSLLEGHAPAEFETGLERQLVLLLSAYLQAHRRERR